MRRMLPIYLGFRYSCSKKHQLFISFISIVSMLGIAIGVTVLVTVLSVMNGFNEEMEQQVFNMAPHILVSNVEFSKSKQDTMVTMLDSIDEVTNYAPYIFEHGLLKSSSSLKPVVIHGVSPSHEEKISKVSSRMTSGKLKSLAKGAYNILLSHKIVQNLGLTEGDQILLMVPTMKVSPMGITPRYKRFTITGFIDSRAGLGMDASYAMVHIDDAKILYQYGSNISGFRLQTNSLYKAPLLSQKLRSSMTRDYHIVDWTEQYGAQLKAVKLEKTMMLLILSLLVVIAAFNLVASLVMIVNEKRSDIAILRTMGAKPGTILQIFIVQGCFVGFIGTALGMVGGLLLALNTTPVVDFLLHFTDLDGLLSTVYRVDHFPSKVMMSDLVMVCSISMVLSFIATIYPAWRGSRLSPVAALRYE